MESREIFFTQSNQEKDKKYDKNLSQASSDFVLNKKHFREKRTFIIKYSKLKKNSKLPKKKSNFITFQNANHLINSSLMSSGPSFNMITISDSTNPIPNQERNLDNLTEWLENLIDSTKSVKKLQQEYNRKKKKIKKHQSKLEKQTAKNEILEEAVVLAQKGFEKSYICNILKIKQNSLKWALHKQRHKMVVSPQKRGRKSLMIKKYLEFVSFALENAIPNHAIFAKNIKESLIKKFEELRSIPLSIKTISKMIKKCGFSWKKTSKLIKKSDEPDQIKNQIDDACQHVEYLKDQREFIFIDETGFNSSMIPIFAYSKRGEPSPYHRPEKQRNISVIAAISNHGIVGFQMIEGSVKGEDFAGFLMDLISNSHEIRNNLEKFVFFMDNASIHKKKKNTNFLECLNIQYNAPYSPFFNPIENVFGLVKYHFRYLQLKNVDEKMNNIINAFRTVTVEKTRKIIRKGWKNMLEVMKNRKII